MGKMSRNKGKVGEREIANILKSYGFECRRGQQYCGTETSADVVGLDGIHIECKRVEKLNLKKAMEQAQRECGENKPCVMHRANREEWKVTMLLKDWIELYKKYKE